MSFSNSSGGTLALPSPTHAHQIDVTSAVRTLRRSISRSPSKFLSRTNSPGSPNAEGYHQQTSPQSPCRHLGSTPQNQLPLPSHTRSAPPHVNNPSGTHQALFTPFRSNIRLSLRSAKKSSPSRPLTRARASPKSPLKKALITAPDHGNALPFSTTPTSTPPPAAIIPDSPGQENRTLASPSQAHQSVRENRHSLHLDVSGASQSAFLKSLDATDSYVVPTSGSLKRSDATMNLDQPSQGSPVAKRRSLHGIPGLMQSDDQNIFGSNTTSSSSFAIHEDLSSDYELSGMGGAPLRDPLPSLSPSPAPANVPKRSSSLRKSTLQQRYGDRGSLGRRNGERQLAQISADFSPARARPRLSLDQFIPPYGRDASSSSPVSPLPNPQSNPVEGKAHQPHPLSKTLTTSSSGNSLTEEAPFCSPAPKVSGRPSRQLFSRSLPLNATRPTRPNDNTVRSVATPNRSELWPGAFGSTGLISKVNRNPEEEIEKKMAPPDTPCKKHSNPFATYPPPAGSAFKRGNNRNSFGGVPSTPFNPIPGEMPSTFGNPGKGLSIFQRGNSSRSSRRGSLLSFDGDELKLFGDTLDATAEGDAPPTPTKNTMTPSISNLSSVSERSLESPSANRTWAPTSAVRPVISRESTCKSTVPIQPSHLSNIYFNMTLQRALLMDVAPRKLPKRAYCPSTPAGSPFHSLAMALLICSPRQSRPQLAAISALQRAS